MIAAPAEKPRAAIVDPATQLAFVLAGDAVFTLERTDAGRHLTFRVQQPDADAPHFVSVLTGPDNTADYTFLGTVFQRRDYRHGKKSSIAPDAPSARTFAWLWEHLRQGRPLPPVVLLWHEGRCGRCGRALTDPESIACGLGPVCRGRA